MFLDKDLLYLIESHIFQGRFFELEVLLEKFDKFIPFLLSKGFDSENLDLYIGIRSMSKADNQESRCNIYTTYADDLINLCEEILAEFGYDSLKKLHLIDNLASEIINTAEISRLLYLIAELDYLISKGYYIELDWFGNIIHYIFSDTVLGYSGTLTIDSAKKTAHVKSEFEQEVHEIISANIDSIHEDCSKLRKKIKSSTSSRYFY